MNRVTASGTARLLQCSGHARLPWVRETSSAAENGTRCHALMEHGNHEADPQTFAAYEAWREWLSVEGYVAPAYQREWPMALCMESRHARPIAGGAHRDYSAAKPTELCGTADLCGTLLGLDGNGNVPFVLDWKFGAEPVDADSAQMRTLAAMHGYLERERPDAVMAIVVQAPPDGGAFVRAALLKMDDLDAHVDMLAESWNEAREAHVLQRGPECKYCPASASCPAQLAALSQLVAPGSTGIVTPERAGAIWLELRQAKKRLELIEDACKALAQELDGLPLPGGKRLVMDQRTRTTTDTKALEAIARQHGATSAEIAACQRTTTYTTATEKKA